MTDTANSKHTGPPEVGLHLPEFVDWIAATVIALAGVALTVGGSALAFVVFLVTLPFLVDLSSYVAFSTWYPSASPTSQDLF